MQCSAAGQKLNSWSVGWSWTTSDMAAFPNVVAEARSFVSRGNNVSCAKNCIRKGSALAVGVPVVPMCGNGVVEAGEDCDPPFCRFRMRFGLSSYRKSKSEFMW
jgi:hypothetical protein